MSEFETAVLEELKAIGNGTAIICVVLSFMFLIGLAVVFIYASQVDKKDYEKRKQKIKDYIDEEIKNAKK